MRNANQRTQGTQIAPRTLLAGEGFLIGTMFCVAKHAAASGASVETAELPSVYTLTKLAGTAWTPGVKIYWDNTAFTCTVVVGSNTLIGNARTTAISAATTGEVYVDGTAR